VTITILRATTGRKIGKRCVAATPNRRRAKACERFVQVGALARTGVPAGAQSVAFSGRIAAKKLPAGKYRAAIVATTTSGSSAPATVSFSVVPR